MADLFEEMLEEFPPDVKAMSLHLRGVIQNAATGAVEAYSSEQKHLTYSLADTGTKKYILLAPKKTFVFLVFNGCEQLEDSDGLLGSAGKPVRFMAVKTIDEASNPALSRLIGAAFSAA